MSQPLIRLENVSKSYPGTEAPAVGNLTMDVHEGEVLVLVGPSGCGKSTTLRLINRLIEPTAGRIYLHGEDVTDIDPSVLRRKIGYVIQQVGLFPHRTIAENIATVPKLLGWDKARINERIDEMLDLVSMDPAIYRDRYPKELSGGQAQRVGVARALAADPDVLLMDEPFGALDEIVRDHLNEQLLKLWDRTGKTIAYEYDLEYGTDTIEIQEEAIQAGQRVVILDDLLATGGTMAASIELVRQVGGDIRSVACIIELSFLNGRSRFDAPFTSLITYDE